MHQNPQCLCSSSSRPLPEWRNLSELRAPVLVFFAVHRSPCVCRMWAGPPKFAARGSRTWERERIRLGFAFQHLWVLVLFLSISLDYQTQEPKWLVNEISISTWLLLFVVFPLPRASFLFVLLFKCCETDAEVSASKRCSVMGWACSVFGCRMSPSGPAGENLTSTAPPVMSLHCLNLSSALNLTLIYWHRCSRVLSAWLSWRPAGADCSGSACLSSVDLCSTPGLACLCAGMCVFLRYLIVL